MKTTILSLLFCALGASAQVRVDVYFDFDRSNLTDEAATRLENSFNAKNIEVAKIYGYCDWKGSNAYNDSLSLKRVATVHQFLQAKGIPIRPDYEIKGFGEDFQQSEIQSENRKVTIVYNELDPKPNQNLSLTSRMKTLKPGDKIKLENINFHNNSAVIVSRSKSTLYELLCVMEENPKLKIEIQGHICCQSEKDINNVSTSRARAIYNFLIRNKISKKRLSFKGFGISQPIYPIPEKNDREADENRRVEILIVEN